MGEQTTSYEDWQWIWVSGSFPQNYFRCFNTCLIFWITFATYYVQIGNGNANFIFSVKETMLGQRIVRRLECRLKFQKRISCFLNLHLVAAANCSFVAVQVGKGNQIVYNEMPIILLDPTYSNFLLCTVTHEQIAMAVFSIWKARSKCEFKKQKILFYDFDTRWSPSTAGS